MSKIYPLQVWSATDDVADYVKDLLNLAKERTIMGFVKYRLVGILPIEEEIRDINPHGVSHKLYFQEV